MADVSWLAEALKANYIPEEPYIHLPNLQISPTGIPYIQLPEPCSAYCLTNYLSSDEGIESDAKYYNEILSIPSVNNKLAMFVIGGSISREIATKRIKNSLEAKTNWCLPVVRLTTEVVSSPLPRFLGYTGLSRNTHMYTGIARSKELVEADKGKSDKEMTWSVGCWLSPEHSGKGIMTVAYKYIITHFFLEHLYAFDGQLVAGYLATNRSSSALLHRLGFRPVAKSYWVYETRQVKGLPLGAKEDWKSACTLWQGFNGEHPVTKDESTLVGLEDWDEEPR